MTGDETLTLLRSAVTGVDSYGNDVTTDTELALLNCQVQPARTNENVVLGDQVQSEFVVYAPSAPVVKATDRVRRGPAGSLVYAVDGDVAVWPGGVLAGQEFALSRATG